MGVFSNIQNALNTRLSSLSAVPTIQWPNTSNEPVLDDIYIRPTLIPATSTLSRLSGQQTHKGIYQIDVFVPLSKGLLALNEYLDSILSHFRGQSLTAGADTVHVQAVGVGRYGRENAWYRSYVEVYYYCES